MLLEPACYLFWVIGQTRSIYEVFKQILGDNRRLFELKLLEKRG